MCCGTLEPVSLVSSANGETGCRFRRKPCRYACCLTHLKTEMDRNGIALVHMAARVVLERQFNDMLGNVRNKGSALFSITAQHLDHLLRNFGSQGLTIFCDRHGGRERYGHLLRLMFEEWSLTIVEETESISRYLLSRGSDVALHSGRRPSRHA